MEQYIPKDALVAEIERMKVDAIQFPFEEYGTVGTCNKLLSFLDTLEVKEINNVWHDKRKTIPEDGSEQIICIKEDGLAVLTSGKIVNGTIKWAYLGDLLNININVEVKEVDLEKELNDYGYHYDYVSLASRKELVDFARHFFELGLKTQKGE